MNPLYTKKYFILSITSVLLLFAVAFFISSCKKTPTDNVQLRVNTDIIKYSVLINVGDGGNAGTIPANAKIRISGPDEDYVYEISGKKSFALHDNGITIGLSPALVPNASRPANFNIEVSADGYLPVTQQVVVKNQQFFQKVNVKLFNLSTPPAGYYIAKKEVDASSGKLTSQQAIKVGQGQTAGVASPPVAVNALGQAAERPKQVNASYADDALTSVVLPEGTSFYYYKTVKGVATGTRQIPIYGDPVTIAGAGKSTPNVPISITGGSASAGQSPGASASITYTPIVGYYTQEYQYATTEYVKTSYSGKVNVVCLYSHGVNHETSLFPYTLFQSRTIGLLNNASSPEDELLFNSGVLQHLDGVYFIGKNSDGTDLTVSPDQSASWTTSYVLDPATINPHTGHAIQQGDSIETGIDYSVNKTLRSEIIKVNGQLRAQSQTPNMGYYYNAPNKLDFTYNFNTASSPEIPDVANQSGYYMIDCGVAGGYYGNLYPNSGVIAEKGKIVSKYTISTNATYHAFYFDQQVSGTLSAGGQISPFGSWPSLKPLLTIKLTLTCTGDPDKPITVYPTYSSYMDSKNGSFTIDLRNGTWSTRGLASGQQLTKNFYIGSGILTFKSADLTTGDNAIDIVLGYKDNYICSMF